MHRLRTPNEGLTAIKTQMFIAELCSQSQLNFGILGQQFQQSRNHWKFDFQHPHSNLISTHNFGHTVSSALIKNIIIKSYSPDFIY